jgi:hypothetical protein
VSKQQDIVERNEFLYKTLNFVDLFAMWQEVTSFSCQGALSDVHKVLVPQLDCIS